MALHGRGGREKKAAAAAAAAAPHTRHAHSIHTYMGESILSLFHLSPFDMTCMRHKHAAGQRSSAALAR